jgi:hypothetical protein
MDTVHFRKELVLPERRALMQLPAGRFREELTSAGGVTVRDAATGIAVRIAEENDSISITATVPPDTVRVDEKIPVETVVVQPPELSVWKMLKRSVPLWVLLVLTVWLIFGKMKR